MVTKRIIPCLDVRNGRVVKGVNFLDVQDVSDPVRLADYYSRSGADELVFYDITASVEGRKLFTDILTDVAASIFIPLTVGGGISRLEDFERVLSCGADKVSVNSGAIQTPELIDQAAKRYGDQCVVLSVDVKRVDGQFHVFRGGGRVDTGLDALEWIRQGVDRGPARWWSTPLIPTASRAALTWSCSRRCAVWCVSLSSPRGAQVGSGILWISSGLCPTSPPDWRPASSTSGRWPSRI